MEDKLFWPFNQLGLYTVKFIYRFLYKSQSCDDQEYQPEINDLWKKFWGLAVQTKVHNFLWRAIKNSIPSKTNLKRRKIIPKDICDHCKSSNEDVVHALWSCPHLSPIWNSESNWSFRSYTVFQNFKDLVQYI